ncbi:MAG TPA: hypothetical protein VFJ51_12825 [Nitrososphaeraceae archaeon]|nr:hypothetical protein [Nitrososphaeraceae archaeon]
MTCYNIMNLTYPQAVIAIIIIVSLIIVPNYALAQTVGKQQEDDQESPNPPQLMADAKRNGVPPAPPAVPESINLTKCNKTPEGLIHNIANNGLPRFNVVQDCVTVTGKVTLVHTPSDGDTVFALKLDKPFSSMVTSVNIKSPKMQGGIWVEMICQRANTNNEPIHKGDCSKPDEIKEFHWPTPKVGDHLSVTGRYQQDIREGGHMEIHPTSDVTIIK